MVIVEIMKTL